MGFRACLVDALREGHGGTVLLIEGVEMDRPVVENNRVRGKRLVRVRFRVRVMIRVRVRVRAGSRARRGPRPEPG